MLRSKRITNLLREHERAHPHQEIANAFARREPRTRRPVAVVLQKAHQQSSVAPEQCHVGILWIVEMESAAEISLRLLQGDDLVHQRIQSGSLNSVYPCRHCQSPDVSAREIAAVF